MSKMDDYARKACARSGEKRGFRLVCGVALAAAAQLMGGPQARGGDLFFDGDGVGTVQSNSGLWDLTSNNWAPTAVSVSPFSPWVDGSNAVFNGPGGTITLSGAAVTAGGVDFQSGKYFVMSSAGGTLAWGNNASVNVAAGADLQVFSSIGGSGGFTKTGQGSFGFYNNGVFSGPVNVNEGSIYFASSSANFNNSTAVTVAAGATFDFRSVNDPFGSIAGAGTIRLGTLGLGITTGSRMQVGSDNSTTTFSGSILGSGGRFDKEGTGTLTLSGANTFNGFVTVAGGKLRVENGAALGDNAPVFLGNVASAVLELGADEAVGSLGNGGDTGGSVNVNGFTLTIGGDNLANNYQGGISGGGKIVKTGTGVQIINSASTNTANSTFTGKYVVESGILGFRANGRLGAAPATNTADYITLAGGELSTTGFGGTTLSATKGITVTADSTISSLGTANSILVIGSSGGAPITGTNSITKRGSGVLRVDSDSGATFSGAWVIRDGTLNTTRGITSPLGTGSYDVAGGTLSLTPGGTGVVAYTLARAATNSTFAYGPGAVLNVNRGSNTSFTVTFGNVLAAPNSVLVQKPHGTMVITAAGGAANLGNTVTGEAILFNGGVQLADTLIPGVIATTNFAAATSAGDFVSYGVNGVVAATYTSGDLTTSTPANVVQQSADVALLANASAAAVKLGDGVTAASVDLGGQTLTVGNGTSSGMVILNAGANFNGAGTIDFRGSQGVIYSQLGNNEMNARIAGSNGLSKVGPGTLTLRTTAGYTGPTEINQGSLILTADNQLPTTTRLSLNGNATLDLTSGASQEVDSLNAENLPAVSGTGGAFIAFGQTSVLKISGSGDMVFRGGTTTPAGAGGATIWKAGPGTLTLGLAQSISTYGGGIASPAMSYDKLWITGGGVVALSSGNSITDTGGALADAFLLDNGTLRINTLTTANVAAGGVSLFNLTSAATNVRGITVGPGGGTIDIVNPYEIVFEQTSNSENVSANLISGTGTLTKVGEGFFRLGYGNSFTGNWVIKAGALQFQRDGSLGADTGSFASARVTIDGGMIQSNGSGIFGANYGVFVTANGGKINGPFVFNSKISGPGTLERLGGQNATHFNATDNTFGGIRVTNGNVYFNADNSAGLGTVVMDPIFQVGLGKNEGPDSTINNPIQLNDGALIDIRVTSDVSPIVGSVFNGLQTGTLTLAGKISGSGRLFKGFTTLENYRVPPLFAAPGIDRTLDGTVVLANGANDFTGAFTVSLGTAEVTASGALGATGGATIVNHQGTLALRNVNYTVAEPVFVSGSGKAGLGALRGVGGNSTFAGPVGLMGATSVGVDAGAILTLAGPVTGAAPLDKVGTGRLRLANAGNVLGDVAVQEGSLEFAASHRVAKLSLKTDTTASLAPGNKLLRTTGVNFSAPFAPDAKLDLTDGRLIVDYGDLDFSPLPILRAQIIASYMGTAGDPAKWSAPGITSSVAAANPDKVGIGYAEASEVAPTLTWLGEPVDGTAILIRTTLLGDANLDGKVGFSDLVAVAQNYDNNSGLAGWSIGDFNYDGNVGFADLVAVAQNYDGDFLAAGAIPGASADFQGDLAAAFAAAAAVPEPGSLALVAAVAGAALGARRRRRN